MPEEANTATPPATEPVTTSPATEQPQAPTEAEKPEAKTLTQAEIDEIISKRVGREKAKADEQLSELRRQYEETQATLRSYQEKEEEAKRALEAKELEKAKEKGEFEKVIKLTEEQYLAKVKTEAEKYAQAVAERDAIRSELEKTKIDNALYAEAAKLAVDPADVVALIKGGHQITLDPKTHAIVVDGDSDTSLEQVVRAFLDKKPHLAKSQYDGKAGAGSTTTPAGTSGLKTFTRDQITDLKFYREHKAEIEEARKAGRIK